VDDWEKTVKQIAADSEKKTPPLKKRKRKHKPVTSTAKIKERRTLTLRSVGVLGVEILVLKTPPPLFFVKSEFILPLSFPPQKHSYLKHQV
jgi:hypothetical protein